MEEMTIQEKARRYDEAIERARKLKENPKAIFFEEKNIHVSDYIFPELQESEGEKVRKTLIKFFEDWHKTKSHCWNVSVSKILAWLQKQGEKGINGNEREIPFSEQKPAIKYEWSGKIKSRKAKGVLKEMLDEKIKPADKVEPKFQKDDWVVHNKANFVFKVVSIGSNGYEVVNRENNKKTISFDNDVNYHLWTIQDAKDGDLIYVSTEEKGIQAIFHEYKNKTIFFHCYLCRDFVQGGYMPIDRVELVYPLQKTHHKRFFEKMHEADCEWDVCKKTLKKIEQKTAQNKRKYIYINQNIIEYINKRKWRFENKMPHIGDVWHIIEITSYTGVNGGQPVVEVENKDGEWMRLPLDIVDIRK